MHLYVGSIHVFGVRLLHCVHFPPSVLVWVVNVGVAWVDAGTPSPGATIYLVAAEQLSRSTAAAVYSGSTSSSAEASKAHEVPGPFSPSLPTNLFLTFSAACGPMLALCGAATLTLACPAEHS